MKYSEMRTGKEKAFWNLGVMAYGIAHAPKVVVNSLKEIKKINERERCYKGILKLKEYCDEMVADGKMTEEKRSNLIATAVIEYAKMHK